MEIIIKNNQIVKTIRDTLYFFNEEGILCKISFENGKSKDWSFLNNRCICDLPYVDRAIRCLEPGDTIEKFESNIKRFKCIYEKRKQDSVHNVIFKRNGKLYYFFNSQGIYSSIHRDEVLNSDLYYFPWKIFRENRYYFIDMTVSVADALFLYNYNGFKRAVNLLKVGQTINDLIEIYNAIKPTYSHWHNDLERFVTTIEEPEYVCIPENQNKNTSFDYVYVTVNVVSEWYTDRKSYINSHSREIKKMVLERIETDKNFKKYGLPINFLKLSRAIFSPRKSSIQFLFELKDIEN